MYIHTPLSLSLLHFMQVVANVFMTQGHVTDSTQLKPCPAKQNIGNPYSLPVSYGRH